MVQHKHHSLLNTLKATATTNKSTNTTQYTDGSLKQLRQLNPSTIYFRNFRTGSVTTMKNVKTKASTSIIALAKELGLRRIGSRSLMSKQDIMRLTVMHYGSNISSCNSFGAMSPGMESIRWRSCSLWTAASSAYRSLLSYHHMSTRRMSAED
jgi:hypothetical protein